MTTSKPRRPYHRSLLKMPAFESVFVFDPSDPAGTLTYIDNRLDEKAYRKLHYRRLRIERVLKVFTRVIIEGGASAEDVARFVQDAGLNFTAEQVRLFSRGGGKSLIKDAATVKRILETFGLEISDFLGSREPRAKQSNDLKNVGCRIFEVTVRTETEEFKALVYGYSEDDAGYALQKYAKNGKARVVSAVPHKISPGRIIKQTLSTRELEGEEIEVAGLSDTE